MANYRGDIGAYGSHYPILAGAVASSTGPVLEMGCGDWSTPMLHYLCRGQGRPLISADTQKDWVERFVEYRSESHEVVHVADWDDFLRDRQTDWGLVFIDCAPGEKRHDLIRTLRDRAHYILAHDSEKDHGSQGNYLYETVTHLFQYVSEFRRFRPYTLILSNRAPFEVEPCDREWIPRAE